MNLVLKKTISLSKYLTETINKTQNRYLDCLLDQSFQVVNILFILSFKGDDNHESHKQYYLPTVEIKVYNVMIDGTNLFDQPIKNDLKTYDNIRKIAETSQGDDCIMGCLLDYPYFKKIL